MSIEDYIDEVEITEEIPLSNEIRVIIPSQWRGDRLDKSLAACMPQYSRSKLQSWIEAKLVRYLDGKFAQIKDQITGEQILLVTIPEDPQNKAFEPENIPLEIIYSDESIALINKSAGMVVHPAAGNWSGTLLNALLYHFPECDQVPRAGIVHRLDKDTSGLMVVARTAIAQTALVRQLQAHLVNRHYLALVWGAAPPLGKIATPIARDTRDRLRMAVVNKDQGKAALTHFRRLAQGVFMGKPVSLLECRLETGRTHQIRVHLESIGLPLLGDPIYRKQVPHFAKELAFHRQALHAFALGLQHPQTEQLCNWYQAPPSDFMALLQLVQIDASALPTDASGSLS